MSESLIAAMAFLSSLVLTGTSRQYALRRGMIDTPGRRSSHELPTPRGGGMAIVATMLSGLILLALSGQLLMTTMWAYILGGGAVAAVGFVDDHKHVPVALRLVVHFFAASIFAAFFVHDVSLIIMAAVVVAMVWLLNLYNFMDGIDGLAAAEAVTVCAGGIVLGRLAGDHSTSSLIPMLLLGASAGFLVWNFPRARIFMGDVGSGFLGIVIGALALQGWNSSAELFWGWVILTGSFSVDATLTLLRRLLKHERIYEAHRSHAYQIAARRLGDHRPVTLAISLINVVWLLPIAVVVVLEVLPWWLGVALAWSPLVVVAEYFRAGQTDD